MQTPFQAMDIPTSLTNAWDPVGQTFTTVEIFSQEMYSYDGWNAFENAVAPMPFRREPRRPRPAPSSPATRRATPTPTSTT